MNLISEEYRQTINKHYQSQPSMNEELFESIAPIASELIEANELTDVLDYGCGLGNLEAKLVVNSPIKMKQYEPGIEKFNIEPKPADFVICLDVLEYIEEEYVEKVLDHLHSVTNKLILITLQCGEELSQDVKSESSLPALIKENPGWWLNKLVDRFELDHLTEFSHDRMLLLMLPRANIM